MADGGPGDAVATPPSGRTPNGRVYSLEKLEMAQTLGELDLATWRSLIYATSTSENIVGVDVALWQLLHVANGLLHCRQRSCTRCWGVFLQIQDAFHSSDVVHAAVEPNPLPG